MYTYARTAADEIPLDSTGKLAIVQRASRALLVSGKGAATAWAEYRGKKTTDQFMIFALALQDTLQQMFFIAKAFGMDLIGFKAALADAGEIVNRATKRYYNFKDFSPSVLGKVTFAMRDVLIGTRDMLEGARDLEDSAEAPMDQIVFGSDMSIVLSALVMVFKQLRVDIKGIVKARNESLRFFRVIAESAIGAVPPGGEAYETDEPIILAATVRKITAMLHKNPEAGLRLLDALEQRLAGGGV
jgi:hypothetical protein